MNTNSTASLTSASAGETHDTEFSRLVTQESQFGVTETYVNSKGESVGLSSYKPTDSGLAKLDESLRKQTIEYAHKLLAEALVKIKNPTSANIQSAKSQATKETKERYKAFYEFTHPLFD